MNTAVFIRRKRLLALWVITPLTLMVGMWVFSGLFLQHEQEGLLRARALALLIPEMEEALNQFDLFAADYYLATTNRLSIEDWHIIQFNAAAEQAKFIITAIGLTQNGSPKNQDGITRITLSVKGSGSLHEVAGFLKNIRSQDQRLEEAQLQIAPDRAHPGSMLLDAEFGRVYLTKEDRNEVSIQN